MIDREGECNSQIKAYEPINLYLVTNYFHPTLTGAAERFRRYGPGFLKREIRMHVITENSRPKISSEETINEVKVMRFSVDGSQSERLAQLVAHALIEVKKVNFRNAVIQVFGGYLQTVHPLWRARLKGIDCILEFTIIPELRPPRHSLTFWRQRMLYSWCFSPFQKYVVPSNVMQNAYASYGFALSRNFSIIPHGVDLERFRPFQNASQRQKLRSKLGFVENDEIILCVASILPRKRVDLILRAWPHIYQERTNAKLLFLGGKVGRETLISNQQKRSAENYMNEIEKLVTASPCSNRIIFTGEVEDTEDYYRIADVFLFTSYREGMPNAVVEAMACGLPCLLTLFDGFPEIEFGNNGSEYLWVDDDPDVIAQATVDLLNNESLRKSLGRTARVWVEKNMNLETTLDQYAALYRQQSRKDHP